LTALAKPTAPQAKGSAPEDAAAPGNLESVVRNGRRTLVDDAYRQLKDAILHNTYQPGFQATEVEIAGRLKMSRTPVREALMRLQNEGLIEINPRHGLRVLPMYAADLREIYELLCSVEATAVELLTKRRLPSGSPVFTQLQDINEESLAAVQRGDMFTWAEMDEKFHRLLVENCGNSRIIRVIFNVWDQSHRARMLAAPLRSVPVESYKEHRAVLEAVCRGDDRVAYEIHRAHRYRGMTSILRILEEHHFSHI
jgi:DNA-binding GntR family transcriptional regulator